MILLNDNEIVKAWRDKDGITVKEAERNVAKAQAKKILINLQSIYKLPDLKMEHDRMGEFIEALLKEAE